MRVPGCQWPTAQAERSFLLFFLPENEPPSPLVSGIIDYNMPLTSTYLKQMKLRVMNSQEQVRRRPHPPRAPPGGVLTCLDGVDPFRDWGHSLCKHTGNQRGPYLVIWAVQSRLSGAGRNVFLVRGSAGQTALLGLQSNFP